MRLSCAASRAFRNLRTPQALLRNGPRQFSHTPSQKYDVGVIGAGITGLSAAYRLSKDPECSKVTLYEKSDRLGGWIESETIKVDGGDIVFEYGPRTLKVGTEACHPLLDLVTDLQLDDQILLTSKSAPASQNRFIYYPDHLVQLPSIKKGDNLLLKVLSMLGQALREPLFKTAISSILFEPGKAGPKDPFQDESVMEFVSRRLSPELANNLVSSVWHGILAGDIDKLSAEALMGILRHYERLDRRIIGSIVRYSKLNLRIISNDDLLARSAMLESKPASHGAFLAELTKDSTTMTFKNGVSQLIDALATALHSSDKVEILTGTNIEHIKQDSKTSDLTIEVEAGSSSHEARTHNRIIGTISPTSLARSLKTKDHKDSDGLISNVEHKTPDAVTVMVVNLYYPNPNLIPVQGFGYLIPRSIPFEQNPERALGVIFASDSSVGQDTAPGTKLTVMMGGHYWDRWDKSDYPDHDTAVSMAQSLLERHLNITDAPTVVRTRLQHEAIPQPTVGHLDRMHDMSDFIKREYNKRITLAGTWYAMGNTGVVDSVRQAYLATSYGVKPRASHPKDLSPSMSIPEDWDLEGGIVSAPKGNKLHVIDKDALSASK
ncbi:hypothetical protein BJX70DRAFT_384360 [Aspergillus crustosus]